MIQLSEGVEYAVHSASSGYRGGRMNAHLC